MTTVTKPIYQVIYEGKNITEDISKYLTSLRYTDNVAGKLDEIEISLEDSKLKWSNDWYPQKGDKIEVTIGDASGVIRCGGFSIDEVEVSGPPDTVNIRAIAAAVKGKLRSRRSVAHENKTLRQIAASVAADNGLTIQGSIPEISILRSTQNHETDLTFLNRLGSDYGIVFNIKDKLLVFTNIYELEAATPVTEIDKTDCISYSITDKSFSSFKSAEVTYHNPVSKKTVNYKISSIANADGVTFNQIESSTDGLNTTVPKPLATDGTPSGVGTPAVTGDNLLIHSKTENPQQAKAKATAALHRHNSKQQEGRAELPGHPLLIAGNNFKFVGVGANTGNYHIMSSTHTIDRAGGWVVGLDFKRIGYLVKQKRIPKKPRKKQSVTYKAIK